MAEVKGPKPRTQGAIVAAWGTSVSRVSATGGRDGQQGLGAALGEKPGPGREPKMRGEVDAPLVVLACSDPPAGQARWTWRVRAGERVGLEPGESLAHRAVGTALKKTR